MCLISCLLSQTKPSVVRMSPLPELHVDEELPIRPNLTGLSSPRRHSYKKYYTLEIETRYYNTCCRFSQYLLLSLAEYLNSEKTSDYVHCHENV